ncbi:MAG TPA: hypothetical protein VL742_17435 [Casimicrobiaceae bacterium]|nr:hypothetical protein [Casimicrobiaceae bacterium]
MRSHAASLATILCSVWNLSFADGWSEAEDPSSVGPVSEDRVSPETDSGEAAAEGKKRWRIELKRQSTARGTPSESTKTNVKIERLLEGPVSLLRLELPFPDDKTSFAGSPFNPRLGDIKTRVRFEEMPIYGVPIESYVELTFPTANPESLGTGKYQLTAGMETTRPLGSLSTESSVHLFSLGELVEQVVSVAGDPNTKDINYTKFELSVADAWREDYSLKLTLKPAIDWQHNGKTGAVAELEGAMNASHDWRISLMLGGLLWGEGVPSTYSKRVELKLRYSF